MAITVTPSKPAGGRADDWRALKFRARTLTLAGTYATGGLSLAASVFGLSRVVGVLPLGLAPATGLATAELVHFVPSASGKTVQMVQYETGAANAPIAEKTNAEAIITGEAITVLAIGY